MNKDNNKFYITTAIDYASGAPHIGHAYEKIGADVLARWNRNIGKNVFFLTGTDEHGQKVVEKAKEANIENQKFVDKISKEFKDLCSKLNISNDYFIRTTQDEHKKIVQEVLQKSYDNGDIYKGEYEGLYCVGCERYYKEDDLVNGKLCPDHKKEVIKLKQENYFFRLSKYQDKLLAYYKKNSDFISPKSKAQEIINRVEEGLEDISISRSKDKLDWGVEFPFDKEHVTYVWFDALFNYYTGTRIAGKDNMFPANVHLIGHDISWFHTVYWPAFLLSVGLELPNKVFSHGMILDKDGHKMSKSLGNVIEPIKFIEENGLDEFRYFMLALGAFGDDLNFSYELFAERINNDLNNDFGNLISRVHAMTYKYFDGVIPTISKLEKVDEEFIAKLNIFEKFNNEMQELKYNHALETLWTAIRECNAYTNAVSPWKEQDEKRLGTVMNVLISSIYLFAKYTTCFIPTKSDLIFKQYNLVNDNKFKFVNIKAGVKFNEKENLFSKVVIEKKVEVKDKPKEGFEKLNLIVGKIIEVELHPDSEKLFVLQVDLGNEKKQIVSGLQGIYTKEELDNRNVVVIANLKPAKLGGYESNGMILACEDSEIGHDDCGLLTTNLEVGTQISCGDIVANNESQIKSKVFQKTEMFGNNGKVFYENTELKGVGVDKNFKGKIC